MISEEHRKKLRHRVEGWVDRLKADYDSTAASEEYSEHKLVPALTPTEEDDWDQLRAEISRYGLEEEMEAWAELRIHQCAYRDPEMRGRSYDNPTLAWVDKEGATTKIFVLDADEFIQTHLSTRYDHKYYGPALVVETVGYSRKIDEHYVGDLKTWAWIGRLLEDGLASYGRKLTSKTDTFYRKNPETLPKSTNANAEAS